jgi:UDP-N-acetylglucosamine--N-acetylmuramyl-(pentapeptide) pyrophosphoryl-undecaprenol N-acetylglucosamine transferase
LSYPTDQAATCKPSGGLTIKVVVTGGGSGGHITPVLAVAAALKAVDPTIEIIYIGQKGDRLADIPAGDPNISAVYTVRAGKFRRYHGLGMRQLFDVKTLFLNVRDLGYIAIGLMQSWRLMRRLRPQITFTRGGFVSVPVALGGRLCGVPYITHDSDSTPSLANRLIARWASLHAVAFDPKTYPYPLDKTTMVGIPLSPDYQAVTPSLQADYRRHIGVPTTGRMLFVTGGGNGAHQLNQFVLAAAPQLLKRYPNLTIVHVAGRALETALSESYDKLLSTSERQRVIVKGFLDNLYRYSGAADVIIGRGGATNMAEWAIQSKACLIIPSPQLIWNVKNNQQLAKLGAVLQLTELQAEQEGRLAQLVAELLDSSEQRARLSNTLQTLAKPHAAQDLAAILIKQAGR